MTLLAADSSFLIDLLAGKDEAVSKMREIESESSSLAVPSVVVYELLVLSGPERRSKKAQKAVNTVETLVSRIGVVWPLDRAAAKLAADIQRNSFSKGRPLSVRDLFLAATALTNGCGTVVTRNERDFSAIEGLRVETY